jgi:hypothetical protein
MNPRMKCVLAFTLGAFGLILGTAPPVAAQRTSLPASLTTPSAEPAVISNQLRTALQLERKTLAGLEAASSNGETPIDETVIQFARDGYVLIRAAKHGLELRQATQKIPDPLIGVTLKRVDQAWNLSRIPVDKYSWGIPRGDYLSQSIPALGQAIRLLDQVLVVLP